MRRGELRYADLGGGFGRRPVLVVTATELLSVLSAVTCAPVTTRLRGIPTKLTLGEAEGLREASEAACDALLSVRKDDLDTVPLGWLDASRFPELDRAIARALDIRREHLPLM